MLSRTVIASLLLWTTSNECMLTHAFNSKSNSRDTSTLTSFVGKLEEKYIEDCEQDQTPHGFYGAFLQPCEFSFYKSAEEDQSGQYTTMNVCESKQDQIGNPTPVHWIFELHKHMDEDDWGTLSSEDFPDVDQLMLWPDQCVGVAPRCYSLHDPISSLSKNQSTILDSLVRLFPDGIPDGSTHVQVDCRSDALELSRVAYSVANGFEKGFGFVVVIMMTVFLLFIVSMSFCCYGCFRLCFPRRSAKEHVGPVYYAVQADSEYSEDPAARGLLKEKELEISHSKYYHTV